MDQDSDEIAAGGAASAVLPLALRKAALGLPDHDANLDDSDDEDARLIVGLNVAGLPHKATRKAKGAGRSIRIGGSRSLNSSAANCAWEGTGSGPPSTSRSILGRIFSFSPSGGGDAAVSSSGAGPPLTRLKSARYAAVPGVDGAALMDSSPYAQQASERDGEASAAASEPVASPNHDHDHDFDWTPSMDSPVSVSVSVSAATTANSTTQLRPLPSEAGLYHGVRDRFLNNHGQ